MPAPLPVSEGYERPCAAVERCDEALLGFFADGFGVGGVRRGWSDGVARVGAGRWRRRWGLG